MYKKQKLQIESVWKHLDSIKSYMEDVDRMMNAIDSFPAEKYDFNFMEILKDINALDTRMQSLYGRLRLDHEFEDMEFDKPRFIMKVDPDLSNEYVIDTTKRETFKFEDWPKVFSELLGEKNE